MGNFSSAFDKKISTQRKRMLKIDMWLNDNPDKATEFLEIIDEWKKRNATGAHRVSLRILAEILNEELMHHDISETCLSKWLRRNRYVE